MLIWTFIDRKWKHSEADDTCLAAVTLEIKVDFGSGRNVATVEESTKVENRRMPSKIAESSTTAGAKEPQSTTWIRD